MNSDAGTFDAANATRVFDANIFGTRPAPRQPQVSWPQEDFVTHQNVFPRWSFAFGNANFAAATLSMNSNGVSVAVALQPDQPGFGTQMERSFRGPALPRHPQPIIFRA